MKKLPVKQLQLNRETLRTLATSPAELQAVVGGWTATCTARSQCGTCPEA